MIFDIPFSAYQNGPPGKRLNLSEFDFCKCFEVVFDRQCITRAPSLAPSVYGEKFFCFLFSFFFFFKA